MAKKRKISQKRVEEFRRWLLKASDQQVERYAGVITPSLQRAAEAFHLDPQSDWHREILVNILAQLMFGDGKRGRPRNTLKWDWDRAYNLGDAVAAIRQEKPDIPYSQVAKIILHRYPKEYADCSEAALRRRVRDAHEHYTMVQKAWEEDAEAARQQEPPTK
jgi:hypothetical protein